MQFGLALSARAWHAGQGLVEYSLILLFIAVAVVTVAGVLGTTVSGAYELVANQFP
jgi:Flp pilus assembly pilin Flp